MKRLLAVALLVLLAACTSVGPGYEGVVVNKAGTDRSVGPANVKVGYVTYNTFTQSVITYPNRVERVAWEGPEAVSFNAQGVRLTVGVALAINVKPGESYRVVQKYGNVDYRILLSGIIRDATRDAMVSAAANRNLLKLLTEEQEAFADDAQARLEAHLAPDGFQVQQLSLTSDFDKPDRIAEQINGIQEAQNFAIEQQQKVAATIAQANGKREAAKGEADANRIRAEGEAEAIRTLNAALKENPEVLKLRTIERWDGRLPQAVAGNGTGLSLLVQPDGVK